MNRFQGRHSRGTRRRGEGKPARGAAHWTYSGAIMTSAVLRVPVDAACTGTKVATAIVDHTLSLVVTHALAPDSLPEAINEAAVTVAILDAGAGYILCDSKTSIINSARGRIHVPDLSMIGSPVAPLPVK